MKTKKAAMKTKKPMKAAMKTMKAMNAMTAGELKALDRKPSAT